MSEMDMGHFFFTELNPTHQFKDPSWVTQPKLSYQHMNPSDPTYQPNKLSIDI